MSVRLYVGNLPEDLTRPEFEALFVDAGEGASAKLITDRKTGKCRGFGFVTVETDEQADQFIEKYNETAVKETTLKVEKAQPRTGKEESDEAPASAPPVAKRSSGGGKGGGQGGGQGGGKSGNKGGGTDSDSIQPDPRWAQDLEKLKQLLAAQTTNS
jgi:RNA recognition motif-containing protein